MQRSHVIWTKVKWTGSVTRNYLRWFSGFSWPLGRSLRSLRWECCI